MVIKRSQIAAASINWEDKAAGLESLAAELKIGLDSMVFIDDSEVECERIRQFLPMVDVICLAECRPEELAAVLEDYRGFDSVSLSQEDRRRGAMYGEERLRRIDRASSADPKSYYQSLEMTLQIGEAKAEQAARVSQLTQRSNQFNLTTKRYSEEEISASAA